MHSVEAGQTDLFAWDKIVPKKPEGKFYEWRKWTSYLLLAIFFSSPFLKINGHPFILLDFIERKFIIFGNVFWPQDFHIFLVAILAFILFVIVFTVIFGRLWCGWACPQTIFMEMLFRRIEYWIEGNASRQKSLRNSSWNLQKILKKSIKHLIFLGIAFIIGNTFLAYFIGADSLLEITTQAPAANFATFTGILIFSGIFYWIFAFFRERACTLICPYGRLQTVLLDNHSIVVSYDHIRGEKRYKNTWQRPTEAGDCIDCNQCVDVCPTGIDIRQGIQLECVNCTACMDACDFVMEKTAKPKGLIRYASQNHIVKQEKFRFSARIAGYCTVLILLTGVFGFILFNRSDVKTTITRLPGSLYVETSEGNIRNMYQVKILNKTYRDMPLKLQLSEARGSLVVNGESIIVPAEDYLDRIIFIDIPNQYVSAGKNKFSIEVLTDGKRIELVNTTFFAPDQH